jgi:hypothetical protein
MTFSQRTLATLAAVAVLGLGATNAQAAIVVNFGGAPVGTITATVPPGNSINTATTISMPTGFIVTSIGAGDQSGLAVGGSFTVNPGTWVLSPGTPTTLVKSWTTTAGTFTETLNTLTNIDRTTTNALILFYSGTLTGPGITGSQPAFMEATFNQVQGPPNGAITASLTDTSTNPIPEPSTVVLAGLGALGLIGYGLRRRKAMGA